MKGAVVARGVLASQRSSSKTPAESELKAESRGPAMTPGDGRGNVNAVLEYRQGPKESVRHPR